jgi:hypothetical protein
MVLGVIHLFLAFLALRVAIDRSSSTIIFSVFQYSEIVETLYFVSLWSITIALFASSFYFFFS